MPEATYIPLDGSSSRSCGWWSSLTGLERVLIFLSLVLAIFVFALTIALVTCQGEAPAEPTTSSTATTPIITTHAPITTNPPKTTATSKPLTESTVLPSEGTTPSPSTTPHKNATS